MGTLFQLLSTILRVFGEKTQVWLVLALGGLSVGCLIWLRARSKKTSLSEPRVSSAEKVDDADIEKGTSTQSQGRYILSPFPRLDLLDEPFGAVELVKDSMILGRSPDADIVVQDEKISKGHALLRILPNRLMVEDLRSTNGTYINGVRLPPNTATPIWPDDQLRFGRSDFRIVGPGWLKPESGGFLIEALQRAESAATRGQHFFQPSQSKVASASVWPHVMRPSRGFPYLIVMRGWEHLDPKVVEVPLEAAPSEFTFLTGLQGDVERKFSIRREGTNAILRNQTCPPILIRDPEGMGIGLLEAGAEATIPNRATLHLWDIVIGYVGTLSTTADVVN